LPRCHNGVIVGDRTDSACAQVLKWRFENARPDPDFKYFSNRRADCSAGNSIATTSDQGRWCTVQPQGP
jgi:hypothetical protein